MNSEKLFRAIGEISDDKIMEAETSIIKPTAGENLLKGGRQIKTKRKKNIITAFSAVAAVLVLMLLVQALLPAQESHTFVIRAYAMEMQEDGTLARSEIDITRLSGFQSRFDGEVFYIGIGLWFEFEGDNIKTVELSLQEGFFAKQYLSEWNRVPIVDMITVPGGRAFIDADFHKVGDTITFDDVMDEDILLSWGNYNKSFADWNFKPIEIQVKVTFADGQRQEQLLVLEFLTNGDGTQTGLNSIYEGEAMIIGLRALEKFFGVDLNELGHYTVAVGYWPLFNEWEFARKHPMYVFVDPVPVDVLDDPAGTVLMPGGLYAIPPQKRIEFDDLPDYRFPMAVRTNMWIGAVAIPSGRTPCPSGAMLHTDDLFRFSVNAMTGEILSMQFFISEDPTERSDSYYGEGMVDPIAVFEYADNMTEQHNLEYAKFAMELAEKLNIFEGEVLRAIVGSGGWMFGRGNVFELNVSVLVESVCGETVGLALQGRNRKELVAVFFDGRGVAYARNRDGSITEPRAVNPLQYSHFNFDWVNR